MNIEICKKCPKLKNKNCSIMLHEDNNEFVPIIINSDILWDNWLCQMKVIDSKHITYIDVNGNKIPYVEFKDVEVHNDCPFYLEHQINDWNKDECKDM
jgi:choline kinase